MKILYDNQIFDSQEYGGISRYYYELIKRGMFDQHQTIDLSLRYSNNAYINSDARFSVEKFFPKLSFKGKVRLMKFFNQQKSKQKLNHQNFDVFHPTYYDTYFLPYLKRKPYVITFYDMIHEKFSDQYASLSAEKNFLRRKNLLANGASKIIAISESTKQDMVDILGISEDKIEVIYLGSSFESSLAGSSIYNFPYLLYVGNRQDYKNFILFLESCHSLLFEFDIKLVCAGGGRFTNSEIDLVKKLGLEDRIIQCPFDDQILATLYTHALAFVFPSLYEGFGIPVLEAFACGCPCIISNVSSLPEVAGKAAQYFNPNDAHSIQSAVSNFMNTNGLRSKLIESGLERQKLFSWDKTYLDTIKLYESISGGQ